MTVWRRNSERPKPAESGSGRGQRGIRRDGLGRTRKPLCLLLGTRVRIPPSPPVLSHCESSIFMAAARREKRRIFRAPHALAAVSFSPTAARWASLRRPSGIRHAMSAPAGPFILIPTSMVDSMNPRLGAGSTGPSGSSSGDLAEERRLMPNRGKNDSGVWFPTRRRRDSPAVEASRGRPGKKRNEQRCAFIFLEQARCLADQQGG
jgi:hypothetical protein